MKLLYEGQAYYGLDICGYKMQLPVVQIAPGLNIASFVMLGEVNCTNHAAKELAKRLSHFSFDYIICPEAKVLPLAQALCSEMNIPQFVVMRKSVKGYMQNPVATDVKSITTDKVQSLVIDGKDADKIRGKRVLLIDDVVSTGGTFEAMEVLLNQLDVTVVGYAAVLKEGNDFNRPNTVTLQDLPLFVDQL